jgi:predicted MFS family arabinose efflux permease
VDVSSWKTIAEAVAVLAPLVLGLLRIVLAPDRARRALKHDSEIVNLLPPGSEAQNALLAHVERQIADLQERSTSRRDLASFGFALVTGSALGWLTVNFAFRDEWGWKVAAFATAVLTVIFVYGALESVQRVQRDEKGRRKTQPPPKATE